MLKMFAQETNYLMTQPTADDGGTLGAVFGGAFLFVWLLVALVALIGMWKTFQKAGRPGWAALVPFYNAWVLAEIGGKPGWWGVVAGLVSIVPFVGWIVGIVMAAIIMLGVGRRFGKSDVFSIVALLLFSPIGFLMLGFGDAKYDASAGSAPATGNAA